MKKRIRFLLVILLAALAAVRVTAASASVPEREVRAQSIVAELSAEPIREAPGTVSWPAVVLAGLSGTGAGVITAMVLYRKSIQSK